MIMYCFHNNNPIHFTIMKARMIDLKFAFRSMIDRRGFDRSDWSFSRIVWPLVLIPCNFWVVVVLGHLLAVYFDGSLQTEFKNNQALSLTVLLVCKCADMKSNKNTSDTKHQKSNAEIPSATWITIWHQIVKKYSISQYVQRVERDLSVHEKPSAHQPLLMILQNV